jgi:hypothetical protein
MIKPEPFTYYQHRYGGLYQTQRFVASKSTVDKSEWISYLHIWPFEQVVWHRPLAEFIDGRFTELSEKEVLALMRSKSDEEAQKEITATRNAAKSQNIVQG